MSVMEIGKELVALCREGKNLVEIGSGMSIDLSKEKGTDLFLIF